MKAAKILILLVVVGFGLTILALKLFSSFNAPDNKYFTDTKSSLQNNQKLIELFGENWSFGNYSLVQQLGPNMFVTFDVKSSTKYQCIKAKIYEQSGVHKVSEIQVGVGGNPPAPKCLSSSYQTLN